MGELEENMAGAIAALEDERTSHSATREDLEQVKQSYSGVNLKKFGNKCKDFEGATSFYDLKVPPRDNAPPCDVGSIRLLMVYSSHSSAGVV